MIFDNILECGHIIDYIANQRWGNPLSRSWVELSHLRPNSRKLGTSALYLSSTCINRAHLLILLTCRSHPQAALPSQTGRRSHSLQSPGGKDQPHTSYHSQIAAAQENWWRQPAARWSGSPDSLGREGSVDSGSHSWSSYYSFNLLCIWNYPNTMKGVRFTSHGPCWLSNEWTFNPFSLTNRTETFKARESFLHQLGVGRIFHIHS